MLNLKMSPSGLRSDAEPPDAPVCSFAGMLSSLEYLAAPSGSYSSGLERFTKDSPSIDNTCLAHSLLVTTELCLSATPTGSRCFRANSIRNVLTFARFLGSDAHVPDEILVNSSCNCFEPL